MTAVTPMTANSQNNANTKDPTAFLEDLIVDKFHDDQGKTYITVSDKNGRQATLLIRSDQCGQFIRKTFYEKTKRGLEKRQFEKITTTLDAQASFDGRLEEACLRVGRTDTGGIEIDIGDDTGKVIRVEANKKLKLAKPSLKFIRPKGFGALAFDESKPDFDRLWEFINVEDEADRALLACWCLMAFNPDGPFPLLVLQGEQGSAKTTATRMLRALLDPGIGETRSLPSKEQDLFIAAQGNWIPSFDNLSGMRHEMSNALCRLSTGGAFATRQLYTDGGEIVHEAKRPVILNGIDDLVTKPDLASRSVIIQLPVIKPGQRRDSETLQKEYAEARPSILAGLLAALKTALERHPDVFLKEAPRLADFARFATASEPAFGFDDGVVVKALMNSQTDAQRNALELDPVAVRILEHFKGHNCGDPIEGTASEIMEQLEGSSNPPQNWPRTASHFSQHLSRITPDLRAENIEVERPKRQANSKSIIIKKLWSKDERKEAA